MKVERILGMDGNWRKKFLSVSNYDLEAMAIYGSKPKDAASLPSEPVKILTGQGVAVEMKF